MKKNEKHVVTDQEMRDKAKELTAVSRAENYGECEQVWQERIGGNWSVPSQFDYAMVGVFNEVLAFLASRRKDVESDYCSPRLFSAQRKLVLVLSQNFGFTYSGYQWNGTSNDPDDFGAFDEVEVEYCIEPAASNQERVVKALRDYLTVGAAKAKLVDSDSYLIWREALIKCVFGSCKFGANDAEKDIEAFLEKIQEAARTTWADVQINKQMKLLTSPVGREKQGRKKAKRKGVGGGSR